MEVLFISFSSWLQVLKHNGSSRILNVPSGMIEVLAFRKSQGVFPKESRENLRIEWVNKYRSY